MAHYKKIHLILTLFLLSYALHAQVAYYPFDGNANDVVAGNDAVVYGATLATDRDGNPNSAYLFDGVNDYMEVTNPTPFNFGTDEFAVSVWIKLLNSTQDFQMIFQKGDSGGTLPQYWLRINDLIGASVLRALWTDGVPPPATLDYDIADLLFDGKWHHIIFQRTSESNELYIDCILVGSNNDINRDISSSGSLFIGAQHPDIPNSGGEVFRYYNGLIDDIAFYNKAFVTTGAIDSLCLGLTTDIASPPESQNTSIDLYPIPATEKLWVDYQAVNSLSLHIEVVSNDGKVLITHRVEGQKEVNNLELDVTSLAAGHYYVRIYGADDIPQMLSFVKINP